MFYFVSVSYGDENDNSIGEFIVEADSKEEALEICEKLGKEGKPKGVEIDGDEYQVTFLWYRYYDEHGKEVTGDDVSDESGQITFHEDYTIQKESADIEELEKEFSRYHSGWANILKE